MEKKKFRRYPPMVVCAVVAAAMFVTAVAAISDRATQQAAAKEPEPTTEKYIEELVQVIREPMEPIAISMSAQAALKEAPTIEVDGEEVPFVPSLGDDEAAPALWSRDWDGEDSERLMKIAMAEAEGESVKGKALVMMVVLNRVWSDQFPDTIEEVIFQKNQFSPVKAGGRWYTTEPNEECAEALELVMSGWDESQGALYFESCKADSWHSRNLEFLFQEGNHKFYR